MPAVRRLNCRRPHRSASVTISGSTFNNNVNKGIYLERLSNATFTDIEVDNSGTGAVDHSAGIDLNLKYGDYQDIQNVDSTITDNGTGSPNGTGAPSSNGTGPNGTKPRTWRKRPSTATS